MVQSGQAFELCPRYIKQTAPTKPVLDALLQHFYWAKPKQDLLQYWCECWTSAEFRKPTSNAFPEPALVWDFAFAININVEENELSLRSRYWDFVEIFSNRMAFYDF